MNKTNYCKAANAAVRRGFKLVSIGVILAGGSAIAVPFVAQTTFGGAGDESG